MFTAQVTRSVAIDGIVSSFTFPVTSDLRMDVDAAMLAGTNVQLFVALPVARIQLLQICSNVAMTLKTNSSGSPANTITLLAGQPFSWATGDPPLRDTSGALITTDIATMYRTNALDANLSIRCIYDGTA
jgi:hypothetical protein